MKSHAIGIRPALAASPSMPAPLRLVFGVLPPYPGSAALALIVNVVLRDKLPRDFLAQLDGRIIAIELSDLNCKFSMRVAGGHFFPARDDAQPAIRFRACVYDFALLASGEQDADALFFQRRLWVEGDTELALMAKNALDAVDVPLLRRALRLALKVVTPSEHRANVKQITSGS